MKRFQVFIYYKVNEKFLEKKEFLLEEISELSDIVENLHHWDTIDKIEIFKINKVYPDLTVAESYNL